MKQVTIHDGLGAAFELAAKGKPYTLSPKNSEQLARWTFTNDFRKLNPEADTVQVATAIIREFGGSRSMAYLDIVNAANFFSPGAQIDQRDVHVQIVLNWIIEDREREIAKGDDCDSRALAVMQKNYLHLIEKLMGTKDAINWDAFNLPDVEFVFDAELVKSTVTTDPDELKKLLAPLLKQEKRKILDALNPQDIEAEPIE